MVPVAVAHRHTAAVVVVAEEVHCILAAVDAVGVGSHHTLAVAVGCSTCLSRYLGRFVDSVDMIAADCSTNPFRSMNSLVGAGGRVAAVGCSGCLRFAYSGCPPVGMMRAAPALYTRPDVVRSHCSQSYFAATVSISKLLLSNMLTRDIHDPNLSH